MNVVFFGSSSYVVPILEALRKNFSAKGGLSLVLTTEKLPTDPIPSYCIKSKVRCYVAANFRKDRKILQILKNTRSTLGILASFGAIIPKEILQTFSKGIMNIHPSLLPKYRGPTPVQTAILNGEKITGVSIMKLDEEIDHGPILGQEKEEILSTDTAESLYKRLFAKGAKLLPKILDNYIRGDLKPTAQNHKEATFTKPLTRQDGFIDISKIKDQKSKIELERKIRAYFPWPGVYTKLKMKNEKLKIIKFLPEQKLQVEGKKPMTYKDFINGYPKQKNALSNIIKI